MPETTVILDAVAIQRALTRIAHEIAERNEVSAEVVLVGIPTGGDPLARAARAKFLPEIWKQPVPVGMLDVSMHRDDLDQRAAPKIHPTVIPVRRDRQDRRAGGRRAVQRPHHRAAMDALNDFGRPKKIQLAVLVDRGHRELPIKADFVGKNVPTALEEKISLRLVEIRTNGAGIEVLA